MGKLTTHVLDTTLGKPGDGIRIDLFRLNGDVRDKLGENLTNDDGRCDAPLLEGPAFTPGVYELVFHVGAYFDRRAPGLPDPKFLDVVPVRFGISNGDSHYHVPLLISPYSYSTYRGS